MKREYPLKELEGKEISYSEMSPDLPELEDLTYIGSYYMGSRYKKCDKCENDLGFKIYKFRNIFYTSYEGDDELEYTVRVYNCRNCNDIRILANYKQS